MIINMERAYVIVQDCQPVVPTVFTTRKEAQRYLIDNWDPHTRKADGLEIVPLTEVFDMA